MADYKANNRDRIASFLCNLILNHIATTTYRDFIEGAISLGIKAVRNGTSS